MSATWVDLTSNPLMTDIKCLFTSRTFTRAGKQLYASIRHGEYIQGGPGNHQPANEQEQRSEKKLREIHQTVHQHFRHHGK